MPSVSSRRNTMSTSRWTEGMLAWDSEGRTAANRSNFLRTGGITARIGGVPGRPHHPAVETAQGLLGHRRQRVAVLLVPLLADRQPLPLDIEAFARRGRRHHLDAFRNDFEADIVAEQNSDLQRQ